MGYHLDDAAMALNEIADRLEGADLIPSQVPLLEGLRDKLRALETCGVSTIAALRAKLKKPATSAALAAASGISPEYLNLLRRAIEGWFGKPPRLEDFVGLDKSMVDALRAVGILDARDLYEAVNEPGAEAALSEKTGLPVAAVEVAVRLADLTRIQWVSPAFARVLYEAGYRSPQAVAAAASSDDLYAAVSRANEGDRFYRGVVGKRDMGRLIRLAAFTASRC